MERIWEKIGDLFEKTKPILGITCCRNISNDNGLWRFSWMETAKKQSQSKPIAGQNSEMRSKKLKILTDLKKQSQF